MKSLPYTRKKEILEMLKRSDHIDVHQLSKKFNVSYMTVHRDLKELEQEGIVSRVYGGAVARAPAAHRETVPDLTLEERFSVCQDEKQSMAAVAAQLVQDGEVICLDASTSALQMCPLLRERSITVVTNSLNVALQFADSETVNVLMVGGFLRKSSLSFGGIRDPELLRRVNIDRFFFSATAVSYEKGVTECNLEESEVKREMLHRSSRHYVLADHTKLGMVAPYVDCTWEEVCAVITDRREDASEAELDCLRKLEENGVRIMYGT